MLQPPRALPQLYMNNVSLQAAVYFFQALLEPHNILSNCCSSFSSFKADQLI
eukprot:c17531_g2_i1 orf=72-227(-)